ncbi:MAG: tetratricopeptide repeat protein [Elusimicrobia bacterium]|nr:tetratricopeptide repeat protein [Elusimicrobiota bacterium]
MEPLPRLLARWSAPLWARCLAGAILLAGAWQIFGLARDAYDFYGGRFFDDTGRYGRSAAALESYLSRHPEGPRACRVRLRLGRVYNRRFGRWSEARRHFEAAARSYDAACASAARAEIMNCPDYFPLDAGRQWIYGDTASGGRNMRLEVRAEAGAGGRAVLRGVLYAGKKRLSSEAREFRKKDWAVWEGLKKGEIVFMRYPFAAGSRWRARREGRLFSYRVEAGGQRVSTLAGSFSDCIKIRETDPRFAGRAWKFDYYAPGVGRVKTTVGAPGVENPNTELVEFVAP